MELRHLRYFVAVAQEQNITRAAARLHVSQPPLSRQMQDLETELGVTLLERTAKSVRLTDAGRIFLEEAQAVLRRADEAVQVVRAVADGQQGDIHVGYAPSLTVQLLPRILRLSQEKLPRVRIALHDLSTAEMLDGLRTGSLHVALMIQVSRRTLAGLASHELRRYALCVAAAPSHPLAQSRRVTLQQVAADRLLGYSRSDYPEYHEWLHSLFAPLGVDPILAEEHDGASSLIAAVEGGRGIALVPQTFSCFVGARLSLRPLSPPTSPFAVIMAYKSPGLPARVKQFIGLLEKGVTGEDDELKLAELE